MDVLNAIGNTPLVKLCHLSPRPDVTILLKLEFMNPTGSIKDRIVKHMIEAAEKSGELKPGGTIVENTSGNTGAAIGLIAASKGYKVILTMPDKVSIEKQNTLRAFGCDIVMCPTSAPPDSPEHYVNKAKQIAKETPNSYRPNQYDNPKNPEAHYLTTGPEIWKQTGGHIDYFVASGSTGGTVSGVGKYLKEQKPDVQVWMPDPIGSIYYEYFKTKEVPHGGSCTYLVEGIGEDHLTKAMDFCVVDGMMQVNDKEAFHIARELATKEGILGGGSTGVNVWGAIELAKKIKGPATIVTIAPDSGLKYLSKIFDDKWMKEHQLL